LAGRPSKHSPKLKAQVALAAIKGHHTINEIATSFSVHPAQVSTWKKQALNNLIALFEDGSSTGPVNDERVANKLYQQIGQLSVELEWLKKKSGSIG